MVAHVVQGLLILARSWVVIPLRLILGAHRCNSFHVVESGGVFRIISWPWSIVLSLLLPDVLSLRLANANRRHLLPRR